MVSVVESTAKLKQNHLEYLSHLIRPPVIERKIAMKMHRHTQKGRTHRLHLIFNWADKRTVWVVVEFDAM